MPDERPLPAADPVPSGGLPPAVPPRIAPARLLTAPRRDGERDASRRPLNLSLIRRLLAYTRPYRVKRNWLLCAVVVRAVQLP